MPCEVPEQPRLSIGATVLRDSVPMGGVRGHCPRDDGSSRTIDDPLGAEAATIGRWRRAVLFSSAVLGGLCVLGMGGCVVCVALAPRLPPTTAASGTTPPAGTASDAALQPAGEVSGRLVPLSVGIGHQ